MTKPTPMLDMVEKELKGSDPSPNKIIAVSGLGCFGIILSIVIALAIIFGLGARVFHWIAG